MNDPMGMAILFLVLGLVVGGLAAWLITRFRMQSLMVHKKEIDTHYIHQSIHQALQDRCDIMREDLAEKEEEIRALSNSLASKDQQLLFLDDKLRSRKDEMAQLQKESRLEFEALANRLLEEKSQKFTNHNQQQLHHILKPLQERIKTFEEGIEKRFFEETRDRISLKKEIEQLRELNTQLSQDANNLANALKGDNKIAGDWGEVQLEMLLQRAGLSKNIHYEIQNSYTDENGQQKRPDFIINLPNNKHLIIDSKVSLKAYDKYFKADSSDKQQKYLTAHIDSIRRHIKDLSSKNYQQLYQINSPDYLLLFIPIEPAFSIASQHDQKLFTEALDRNIVIVTTSTLLATMRTVSYIWKQEKQKKSVLEIARQSGLLYDRFCSFVTDLQTIGNRIDSAQNAYYDAMRKLTDSKKYGDTLIGRAEKLKELGARTTKSLPKELLDD